MVWNLIALVGVVVSGTGSAFASFDLSLIPQPSSGQVRRYDPSLGVGLGGFSAPGANNVTLDQANGRIFVSSATSTRLRSYNYSTGAFLGEVNLGVIPGQFTYNATTNSIFLVSATGNSLRSVNVSTGAATLIGGLAGITFRTVMSNGNAVIFAGTNGSNLLNTQSFDATSLVQTDTLNTGITVLPGTRMGKGMLMTSGASFRYGFTYVNALGGVTAAVGPAALNGFVNLVGTLTLPSYGTTVLPAALPGHNGFYFLGSDASSSTVMRVNGYGFSGEVSSEFTAGGYSFADSNFGAANVVAPEPGTLVALGLGAMALVRRRRKKV